MRSEICPHEASALAARRSANPDAEPLEHLRQCPLCREMAEVSDQIHKLGDLPNAPALPDPDRLWLLARIAAHQGHALRALRMRALHRVLEYGLLSAGAAWWFLSWLNEELGVGVHRRPTASVLSDPVVSVMIAVLAALAAAFVVADNFVGRRLVAKRLRCFGLL